MPLTPRQDPNSPTGWTWVDSATGQPDTTPGGPNTPSPGGYPQIQQPQPAQVPQAQNIDPNASRPQPTTTPYGPASPGTGTTPTTAGTVPAATGNPQADQILSDSTNEVQQANLDVTKLWDQYSQAQSRLVAMQGDPTTKYDQAQISAAQNNIDATLTALTAAENRVRDANTNKNTATQKVLDSVQLTPELANKYQAEGQQAVANANYADAQAQVLTQGAESQRNLAAANAAKAANDGLYSQAQAAAVAAKTPYEQQQLAAQAAQYSAQARQIDALLPGLLDKQKLDNTLTQHQVSLTDATSNYYQANAGKATADANYSQAQADYQRSLIPGAPGLQAGQTAQAQGAGAAAQASAAASLAGIQEKQLGPLYGLQDQVNAIRAIQQQVFGPGGSGDPSEADDLLKQYTSATISGTTPYAASVAAANAGLTQFGTQASMYNAAQQALATRSNALSGLAGNVLGTLGTMNANAPAGSTAMAGAFRDVMNYALNQQQAIQQQQQQFGGNVQQPSAPALPPLLQRLAGVGQAGAPGGTPTPTGLPMPSPTPAAPVMGAPNPAAAPPGQSSTGQGVQINVSTGGSQNATTAQAPGAGAGAMNSQAIPGMNIGAMPGAGPSGNQSTPLPAFLQGSQVPTADFVHQLWGKELGSGAVQSPYGAMAQPTPYVGG